MVKAADKIQAALQNFEGELSAQNNFREKILREKYFFVEQVKAALELFRIP